MKRELRIRARELRKSGMSVRTIAKTLNISISSASTWVRDITLSEQQVTDLAANRKQYAAQNKGAQTNKQNALKKRKAYQEEGRLAARRMSPLHMAGCMLYWAEGAKSRYMLYFANSDWDMHKLFIRFLREELHASNDLFSLHVYCHTNDPKEIETLENYWLEVLGLTRANLRKTVIKKSAEIKHSVLKYGVCGLRVSRVEIVQHIFGAIQEYGGFERPEWLG